MAEVIQLIRLKGVNAMEQYDKLTIGQMAKLNGITEQTLRWYNKIGLLSPSSIDPENGYRYYDIKQSAQLDMIVHLKSLGLSLEQIKEYFDSRDVNKLHGFLISQGENLRNQLNELKRIKGAVERAIERNHRYLAAVEGAFTLEYFRERRIISYEMNTNCLETTWEYYDYMLRFFKQSIENYNIPLQYFCNVGTVLSKERFTNGEFYTSECFLFLDDDIEAKVETKQIPGGMYMCTHCNSFEEIVKALSSLREYTEACGYEVTGDCLCESLIESPVFLDNQRNAFKKLQVPVIHRSKM